MSTAGIRPQSVGVIFIECPALKKQFAFRVNNKYRDSPVEQSSLVNFQLPGNACLDIIFIYKYYKWILHSE
jgi:hypothetical protein